MRKIVYFLKSWDIIVIGGFKKGVLKMKSYLEELQKEREGFLMRNKKTNAEIRCTEKFVKIWEQRGFEIVKKLPISLV